jgi:hypothetical protein
MVLISPPVARHGRFLLAVALCCSALIGGALFAAPGTPATPTAATKAAAKPAPAKPATPVMSALRERIEKTTLGVAGLHRTPKGALKCEKCHSDTVAPDDNQTVENRECVSCHEGYPAVAALSAKKLSNAALNAHASHLGPEVACTACHQGHQESKAYCEHCHTNFSMPMPGNKPATR